MTRLFLVFLALALAACDGGPGDVFAPFTGHGETIAVVTAEPVVLTEQGVTFEPKEPLKVAGEFNFVCLVLRDGVPSKDQGEIYRRAVGQAQIAVSVSLSDGIRAKLLQPMPGWADSGRVLASEELSACASLGCTPPTGSTVKKIEVTSAPALTVKGIFWQSLKDPAPSSSRSSSRPPC